MRSSIANGIAFDGPGPLILTNFVHDEVCIMGRSTSKFCFSFFLTMIVVSNELVSHKHLKIVLKLAVLAEARREDIIYCTVRHHNRLLNG